MYQKTIDVLESLVYKELVSLVRREGANYLESGDLGNQVVGDLGSLSNTTSSRDIPTDCITFFCQ